MDLLKDLPDKCVDMVYGDPDYNVGIKYNDKSYTRSFEEYIDWYIELAKESLRVLKDDGNMFLINFPKQNSYLRVKYLDNACYGVRDYVWVYTTAQPSSNKHFTCAHRSILHCRKTKNNKFYRKGIELPYSHLDGKSIRKALLKGYSGRMPYSWFYFDYVRNVHKEKTKHPCQIPRELFELLLKASTQPGDTVFVLFGGSGTEVVACKELGRNFITAEIDKEYCKMIEDRLRTGRISWVYKPGKDLGKDQVRLDDLL